MSREQIPAYTPWGRPDSSERVAAGIVRFSTPVHGGYWLSAERVAAMPECLAAVRPYAGPGWYEEDEDWALVVASFPECFTGWDCHYAEQAIRRREDVDGDAWAQTPQGRETQRRALVFRRESVGCYLPSSCGAGASGEFCILSPLNDGPRLIAEGRGAFSLSGLIRPESLPAGVTVRPFDQPNAARL